MYRAGRLNSCADALSRHPVGTAPVQPEWEDPTQIASVRSTVTLDSESAMENTTGLTTLLSQPPAAVSNQDFATEQRKDPELVELITFLERGELPADDRRARRIILQKPVFTMEHGMLIYIEAKQDHRRRVVVPDHLKQQILTEHHASLMGSRPRKPMVPSYATGGGTGCTATPRSSPGTAPSVQLRQEEDNITDHHCTPSLLADPSR